MSAKKPAAKKPVGDDKKATTIDANDPEALKGTLKHIGGSQSDRWNDILANQTIQTLWLAQSGKEARDRQYGAALAGLVGICTTVISTMFMAIMLTSTRWPWARQILCTAPLRRAARISMGQAADTKRCRTPTTSIIW